MNVLLTNDDGIKSPGIAALIRELACDYQLFVSAPDRQRSAAGASMTIRGDLYAKPVAFPDYPDVKAYAVSGTPVDCVRLGFGHLFSGIDAVISGINLGPNCGSDVLYSGTCSAAQEAAIHGYPALALSLDGHHDRPFVHFETAAKLARRGLELLRKQQWPVGMYFSINVPDLPFDALKGIRYGHLRKILYETAYEERRDEEGKLVYCECGKRIPSKAEEFVFSDEYWLQQGFATVTALDFDCSVTMDRDMQKIITKQLKGDIL